MRLNSSWPVYVSCISECWEGDEKVCNRALHTVERFPPSAEIYIGVQIGFLHTLLKEIYTGAKKHRCANLQQ